MKKGLRITGLVLAGILLLLLALLVAIQSPKVQTALARRAVRALEKQMDGDIRIGSISVKPFDAISLSDVVLLDHHPYSGEGTAPFDTLAQVSNLSARFSLKGLFHKEGIHVSRLRMSGAQFNLVIEPDAASPTGRTNLERVLGLPEPDPDKPRKEFGDILSADRVELDNLTFRMVNYPAERSREEKGLSPLPDNVMDFSDLEVRLSSLSARDISVKNGLILADVLHMVLSDKTGMVIRDVSGKVRVGKELVHIGDLHLQDMDSDLYMKDFRMVGPLSDYSDFLERIRLEAEIEPSVFSMQTITHFAPGLDGMTFKADLQGRLDGTVSDFKVQDLVFREWNSGVKASVNGGMAGLPDIGTTFLDYTVRDLMFDLDGLASFIKTWAPETVLDLSRMGKGVAFSFNGKATGPFNSLRVAGDIASSAGGASADAVLYNMADLSRPMRIGGSVRTKDLDVGKIAGIDAVRQVTLQTALEATLAPQDLRVRLDSLHVDRLRALEYDYTDINAAGTYSGQAFDGRIVCNDPNLNFMFQGLFNLAPNTRNGAYEFYANLGYADLQALGLDKRGRSKVSFQTNANFIRTENRDLLGEVQVTSLVLENDKGRYDIGDITASAHSNDNIHRISLTAPFADGTFVGEKTLLEMVSDLRHLTVERELPALLQEKKTAGEEPVVPYEVRFRFHDSQPLLGFIAPGLYIEDKTELSLQVSREGEVTAKARSGRLAYGANYLRNFQLDADNLDGKLKADITSSDLRLAGIELKDNLFDLTADDGKLGIGFQFDNGTFPANRGSIHLGGDLEREAGSLRLGARVLPSKVVYDGNEWSLGSEEIVLHNGDVRVGSLQVSSDDQSLRVEGGFSPVRQDTLSVRMDRFDISLANSFLMQGKMDLRGRATGRALVISPSREGVGLLAGITCDSTIVAGQRMGQLRLASNWNEEQKQFDIFVRNNLDGTRNMDIAGSIRPSDKAVDIRAGFDRLNLAYASPLMEGIFSDFKGFLNGTVTVGGALDRLHIASQGTEIADGLLVVDFTQVPYYVSGPVSIDTNGLTFRNVNIRDRYEGTGKVTGGILFGGFKDMRMDTHIGFERMQALGIRPGGEAPVYGDVFASGNVDITGPFDGLLLNVDAVSTREGDLHIPIGGTMSSSSRNLLTFTEPPKEVYIDPYDLLMNTKAETVRKQAGDLTVRLRVRATPMITAFIDIGEGNSLNAIGSGLLNIESRTAQNSFTINGDYTVNSGNFHFSALNLVSRDFALQDGSSIRFNGDIMDSDLDVNGTYITKSSLSNLLSDSTSVSRRTVECGIQITDKLRNPQIKLSIDVPDLDPVTQSMVESALNTEDKIQKQFLYLLITNSFLPVEESGITTNNNSMLLSNMTSIMAGQLNNIFQKLDIPLDLGLNYSQDRKGTDLFDVALSTQLFNNRVVVNGTIGNRKLYGTTASNQEVTGDLDIEIKLDKPGTIRLNLFSHSADQYTNFLDNSQRNGVGIAYQRDFRSFRQFFRDLFSPRRKREERAVQEALTPPERIILQIDSTGRSTQIKTHE